MKGQENMLHFSFPISTKDRHHKKMPNKQGQNKNKHANKKSKKAATSHSSQMTQGAGKIG
jgi:hypothetical protein